MSQQSKGTSSFSPVDLPVKRKRGRPRKDESLVQRESMPVIPGSESVKKNKERVGTSNVVTDNMVGQMVSGVIEGSFEAGYLLNVKVGDTDTQLRGVVFLPGRFTPITAANDVAPHAKMYKRKEIPTPVLNLQTQVYGSFSPSGQSNKQPVEHCTPTFPDQVPPSFELRSGFTIENQSASPMVSLADNLPKNDKGLSLGGIVMPQRTLESELVNQSATGMAQLEHDKIVELDKMLQDSDASTLIKGPDINVEAVKELKSESASGPSADILSGIETVKEHQIQDQYVGSDLKQHQAVGSDLKPSELAHVEVRSPNLELNQTPVFVEPKSVSSESVSKPTNILMEERASPKEDIPIDTQSRLAIKILSGDIISHLNGRPVSDTAIITEADLPSAPVTGQPIMMFEGEAIPSEPKLAAEGSILPGMIELNQTPIFAELISSELVIKPTDILMEEQASRKEDEPQDTEVGLAIKIFSGGDGSHLNGLHLNGRPGNDDANGTEAGLYSAPLTTQPIVMFEGKTVPFEPMIAAEGSVLPGMIEHQICSSSSAVNNMDCGIEDAKS